MRFPVGLVAAIALATQGSLAVQSSFLAKQTSTSGSLQAIRQEIDQYQADTGNLKAMYSVVTGGFLDPQSWPYDQIEPDVDRILFTDDADISKVATQLRWKVIVLNKRTDPRLFAFELKMRPHICLAGYQKTMYVDGNVQVAGKLSDLFDKVNHESADMAVFAAKHSIMDEADKDVRTADNRFLAANIATVRTGAQTQAMGYLAKFPELNDTVTFHGAVVVRQHSDKMEEFNNLWFQEFSKGIQFDQLSFRYCALETGLKVEVIDTCEDPPQDSKLWQSFFKFKKKGAKAVVPMFVAMGKMPHIQFPPAEPTWGAGFFTQELKKPLVIPAMLPPIRRQAAPVARPPFRGF